MNTSFFSILNTKIIHFLGKIFLSMCIFQILLGALSGPLMAKGNLPDQWRTPIESVEQIQTPISADNTQDMVNILVKEVLIPIGRYIFIGVGILFLALYAYLMALGTGSEDTMTEQRTNILFAAAGFLVIGFASEFIKIFDPTEKNNVIVDIEQVDSVLLSIVNFMELALGAIAIMAIFYGGIRLITYNGVEERLTDGKNIMLYGFLGFVFVMLADPLVNAVFYPAAGTENIGDEQAGNLIEQAFGILRFLLTFFGAIIFIAFLYAGFLFLLAGVDEEQKEKAKKVLIWTVVGFVIMVVSYAIVMFFIPSEI